MLSLKNRIETKMVNVAAKVISKLKREEGQGMSEYGVILVLVLVVAIPLIIMMRNELSDIIDEITNALQSR